MSTPTTGDEKELLEWSHKQGRILTANGKALEYYTSERGFPFQPDELPHYHLAQHTTHSAFSSSQRTTTPICGAWKRPLFCGTWEHSTEKDETVYNIQTNSLFVDLRIPTLRYLIPSACTSLAALSSHQLRFYARQHVFGGMARVEEEKGRAVCTRHHCVDWNYVGVSRPRPNKWWIEIHGNGDVWKEWAYATDHFGQHYYMERWERLNGSNDGTVLAMRKEENQGVDGFLVVVGNHFNYLFGRSAKTVNLYGKTSTVDAVDAALEANDRSSAEWLLSIDAGHGTVDNAWTIDAAIQPWKEGTGLFDSSSITVEGDSIEDCRVEWNGAKWKVYESSFSSVSALHDFFAVSSSSKKRKIESRL